MPFIVFSFGLSIFEDSGRLARARTAGFGFFFVCSYIGTSVVCVCSSIHLQCDQFWAVYTLVLSSSSSSLCRIVSSVNIYLSIKINTESPSTSKTHGGDKTSTRFGYYVDTISAVRLVHIWARLINIECSVKMFTFEWNRMWIGAICVWRHLLRKQHIIFSFL